MQRNILKELVQTFGLCLVSLLGLILIARGVNMRDLLLGLDLGFFDTVRIFLFLVPFFMLMIVPMRSFLRVVFMLLLLPHAVKSAQSLTLSI